MGSINSHLKGLYLSLCNAAKTLTCNGKLVFELVVRYDKGGTASGVRRYLVLVVDKPHSLIYKEWRTLRQRRRIKILLFEEHGSQIVIGSDVEVFSQSLTYQFLHILSIVVS